MAGPQPGVVLDSSAVIALLRDEPAAEAVERLLRTGPARMSTVNVAETIDVLIRVYGGGPAEVHASVGQLLSSVAEAVPPSLEHAERAGELRARLFDGRRRRVSLADCFVLATAGLNGRIATGDMLLAAVARAEGIEVALLGS